MFLQQRSSALRSSVLWHRAVWHMCTNFSEEYNTTNFDPATSIQPTRPHIIWNNVKGLHITRQEMFHIFYYPRYIWYTRRFGSYLSFRPSNGFNRLCFGAYVYTKCRVPEVNICTVILCLIVQCDWHRATYSLVRPVASIFREKDWRRCNTEATVRPEVLATPIGLQGEFTTETPSKEMTPHTDWRCPATQSDRFRGCFSHTHSSKHMGVSRTNCQYATCHS